jgi:hypothetical protein
VRSLKKTDFIATFRCVQCGATETSVADRVVFDGGGAGFTVFPKLVDCPIGHKATMTFTRLEIDLAE